LKRFFDSSVLVPVFYADHPQHASSTKIFLASGKDDFCALRTLGEVYATLTGLPLRPRITGPEGLRIVKQISERLTLITLNEQEYVSALELASSGTIITRSNGSGGNLRCNLNICGYGKTAILGSRRRHSSRQD
jgi:predicted nucleic acid-binding protein